MTHVTLLLRAALALMFATSATAKFIDLRTSRATVAEFGVPRELADAAGVAIPVAEALCAIALVLQPTATAGALAGAILVAIFSAGVANALHHGRTPDCNCFGQVSSSQIGPATLIRNAVITAIALLVFLTGPGASFASWTTNITAAATVASAAVLVAGGLVIALVTVLRQPRETVPVSDPLAALEPQLDDPSSPIGRPALPFELRDDNERVVSLQSLLARGRPLVLVFSTLDCIGCVELLPELARWNQALSDQITIAVIESLVPDRLAISELATAYEDLPLLYEPGRALAEAYGVWGTPTAIGIDPDGRIATPPAAGGGSVEALIRHMLSHAAPVSNTR